MTFENRGYFKEYYVNGKYIGSLPCDKDREQYGYEGRKEETTTGVVFPNGRRIKPGTLIVTQLQVVCGKMIKPVNV